MVCSTYQIIKKRVHTQELNERKPMKGVWGPMSNKGLLRFSLHATRQDMPGACRLCR